MYQWLGSRLKPATERFAGHRQALAAKVHAAGVKHVKTLEAIATVPRHAFMDAGMHPQAYEDTALPIGHQQTISKPSVVARMIELLHKPKQKLGKVLEIGTGCGYQTSILARLSTEVYSVERLLPLLSKARRNVRELRVMNIRFKHADGHVGIPEGAPFDAIMVTAAATHVPDALKQQLAVGGRMIVPMGVEEQYLCVIERTRSGFAETRLDAVKFVPMLSGLS